MFDYERLYALVDDARFAGALDLLFEHFDDAFRDGRFSEVDGILSTVDVDRLDSHTAIGLLTASYAAQDKLCNWSLCKARVEDRLSDLGRLEALKGFEGHRSSASTVQKKDEGE